MNIKGLSLNTIPPINIPLRFFLTAPLFGVLASLLLIYHGSDVWLTRWNFSSLALTHLLTIGFMLMVMIGALYQFIPVMTGQLIWGTKVAAPIIHSLLILGTLSLVAGFLYQYKFLFWIALVGITIALSLFSISLLPILISNLKKQLIVFLMRLLYVVLLLTIGLGLYMLLAYSVPGWELAFRHYTDLHALWGLIGWVVLLIMTVGSQVIPMFYVTPDFSVYYLKGLSISILLTLIMFSIFKDDFSVFIESLLSLELIFFAVYTFNLINRRKRKLPDTTLQFMYLAITALCLVVISWWLIRLWPRLDIAIQTSYEFVLAILLIYGLAISAIIGMMQKIVPFLIYINLQNRAFKRPGSNKFVLNMKKVISGRDSKIQFYLHLGSLILLLVSVFFSSIIWIAGLTMLANFLWLTRCLYQALFRYRYNYNKIMNFPEMKLDFN